MLNFRKLSDEEIIHQIRMGNEKVLLVLYKRNIDPVRRLILRNNGQDADADDVLQETLVKLWKKAAGQDFVLTSKLDTLIFAIARNLWLKQLRKTGRVKSTAFEDGESNLPAAGLDNEDDKELANLLSQYFAMLGPACRELLSLYYFEQLDMETIARKMQFANADTAKAKKYQCKKKLEELIRRHFTKGDFF
jgi:RNA polymerase sigma factor (sigma-70 family)